MANLENRRRASVTVEELLGLAYVFSVAPLHLMVPIDDGEEYEVVPGVSADLATVRAWVRGQVEPFGDPRVHAAETPASERSPDRHGLINEVHTAERRSARERDD